MSMVNVVVCGAHMSGLPLNHQLLDLGGKLVAKTTTADRYRLFKLETFSPPRPGLLRVDQGGAAIEVEVWALPIEGYGTFVASISAPLGIGTLLLADGSEAQGFLCEHYATVSAPDITRYGSWRQFLKA
jgi:allophanate hydrolase